MVLLVVCVLAFFGAHPHSLHSFFLSLHFLSFTLSLSALLFLPFLSLFTSFSSLVLSLFLRAILSLSSLIFHSLSLFRSKQCFHVLGHTQSLYLQHIAVEKAYIVVVCALTVFCSHSGFVCVYWGGGTLINVSPESVFHWCFHVHKPTES